MSDDKIKKLKELPKHVAIIPDGNRRWAKDRGLPTLLGHREGFDAAHKVLNAGRKLGIHTMTLWGFSTENWNRSDEEVKYLMEIFEEFVDKNLKDAIKDGVRIYHLGRKDRVPASLAKKFAEAEEKTINNTNNVLNIALDYGGHDDILQAAAAYAQDVLDGKITVNGIYDEVNKYQGKYPMYKFKDYLYTKDQPYPYADLIIRTSGEQRLSGFLSWQMAYAELCFAKYHFPDMTGEKLQDALDDYMGRERRFGGTPEDTKYQYT